MPNLFSRMSYQRDYEALQELLMACGFAAGKTRDKQTGKLVADPRLDQNKCVLADKFGEYQESESKTFKPVQLEIDSDTAATTLRIDPTLYHEMDEEGRNLFIRPKTHFYFSENSFIYISIESPDNDNKLVDFKKAFEKLAAKLDITHAGVCTYNRTVHEINRLKIGQSTQFLENRSSDLKISQQLDTSILAMQSIRKGNHQVGIEEIRKYLSIANKMKQLYTGFIGGLMVSLAAIMSAAVVAAVVVYGPVGLAVSGFLFVAFGLTLGGIGLIKEANQTGTIRNNMRLFCKAAHAELDQKKEKNELRSYSAI